MVRSLLVVAVALLAVTAGCSGFGGQSATPADASTEPTTAATTAEPTQTQPAVAAPGFAGREVVDPLALADAHKQHLSGSSFAREDHRTTRSGENATRLATTLRVENESRWFAAQAFDGVQFLNSTEGAMLRYADGDYVYYRLDRAGGNVSYGVLPNRWGEEATAEAPPVLASRHARDYVYAAFTAASWATIVGEETADGATVYHVVGNASGETTFRGHRVSNFEVDADVTGDGFVREMRVTYDRNGTAVTRTVSFSGVGETSVERPEWYDTAANRTDADRRESA